MALGTTGEISPVISEYLQTIYNLEMEGEPVHGAALARHFRKSRANISATLGRMREAGLVAGEGGRGDVNLTAAGRAGAEAELRKHRLSERYLVDALGMDWITAHEQAHHFELAMTSTLESAILRTLGNPTTCPHGNPIPGQVPDAGRYLRDLGAIRLSNASVGAPLEVVSVSEVVEDETRLLRHVGERGLRPGRRVRVVSRVADSSSILVVADDGKATSVPIDLAGLIWVRPAASQ
ncbi:MAG: metal-dependent transcriptional regulator [Chloroflexota bacterium]|nr:MAG: metal-dependent transcriptional regulator [Chloroflexota bacterium]